MRHGKFNDAPDAAGPQMIVDDNELHCVVVSPTLCAGQWFAFALPK
jgi:hypothetical protein